MDPDAGVDRQQALARVMRHARRLGFVRLVHALEQLLPGGAPVGGPGPAHDEPVQFRHDANLCFHASDLVDAHLTDQPSRVDDELSPRTQRAQLTTAFLGLTGSTGPLPMYMAEEVLREDPELPVRGEFLNLFHHRLLGLLYRGLVQSAYPIAIEDGAQDPLSERVLWLSGMLDGGQATGLSRQDLLKLSPLLVSHGATAEALETGLSLLLGGALGKARVRLLQFTGGRASVQSEQRPRLGRTSVLGGNCVLGATVSHKASAVEIEIGPLTADAYQRLGPAGDLHPKLHAGARLLLRAPIDYRVTLELAEGQAPAYRLGGNGATLGRRTWLSSGVSRPRQVTLSQPPDAAA